MLTILTPRYWFCGFNYILRNLFVVSLFNCCIVYYCLLTLQFMFFLRSKSFLRIVNLPKYLALFNHWGGGGVLSCDDGKMVPVPSPITLICCVLFFGALFASFAVVIVNFLFELDFLLPTDTGSQQRTRAPLQTPTQRNRSSCHVDHSGGRLLRVQPPPALHQFDRVLLRRHE